MRSNGILNSDCHRPGLLILVKLGYKTYKKKRFQTSVFYPFSVEDILKTRAGGVSMRVLKPRDVQGTSSSLWSEFAQRSRSVSSSRFHLFKRLLCVIKNHGFNATCSLGSLLHHGTCSTFYF